MVCAQPVRERKGDPQHERGPLLLAQVSLIDESVLHKIVENPDF